MITFYCIYWAYVGTIDYNLLLNSLNNLARLSIESGIAKQIDFETVIRSFANKKARKALF